VVRVLVFLGALAGWMPAADADQRLGSQSRGRHGEHAGLAGGAVSGLEGAVGQHAQPQAGDRADAPALASPAGGVGRAGVPAFLRGLVSAHPGQLCRRQAHLCAGVHGDGGLPDSRFASTKDKPQINSQMDSYSLWLLYQTDTDVYLLDSLPADGTLIDDDVMRITQDQVIRMDYNTAPQ